MEKIMSNAATQRQTAEQINYTALINSFCREFSNWSRYEGIPKYDEVLAEWFNHTGYAMHVRIDFTTIGSEVYIPLKYYSETGIHSFYFPVAERELSTNCITDISPARFLELATQYAKAVYPDAEAGRTAYLMQNSMHTTWAFSSTGSMQTNQIFLNHSKHSLKRNNHWYWGIVCTRLPKPGRVQHRRPVALFTRNAGALSAALFFNSPGPCYREKARKLHCPAMC